MGRCIFSHKERRYAFKNIAKNFKNAKYYIGAHSITDCNYILKVNAVAEYKTSSEYISDELYCSETLRYMKNPINPNNIRKQGVLAEVEDTVLVLKKNGSLFMEILKKAL